MTNTRMDYCINCRKETEYVLVSKICKRTVKGKEYEYETLVAFCKECGDEMSIPGLIDYDNKKFDEAYRNAEGLVSIRDIESLMKLYNLGKGPVSSALGFGEITITRYLIGQMPSKDYSYIIKRALSDPEYMLEKIEQNSEKMGDTAYKKARRAVIELNNSIKHISKKMRSVISYIFLKSDEVTPLALQKLLYFSQGINMAINNKPLFEDDCKAWVHGPVYSEVYHIFKEFKYNPIDDSRYAIFDFAEDKLNKDEKDVLDLVMDTFGLYSGKVLEKITHDESPWNNVRLGLTPMELSDEVISKDSLKEYFISLKQKYNLDSKYGIKKYIESKLV